MQRTDGPGDLVRSIEAIGFLERVGVDRDQRVDRRALLVEGLDAVEIHLHHLAAGELAGFIGVVNVVDGRFDEIEGRIGLSHEESPWFMD